MLKQKRCWSEIIAEILEAARNGRRITDIVTGHNISYSQFLKYVDMLTKTGLLETRKGDDFFVSEDGRRYNFLYVTTEKGLRFLDCYNDILKLLSINNHAPLSVARGYK